MKKTECAAWSHAESKKWPMAVALLVASLLLWQAAAIIVPSGAMAATVPAVNEDPWVTNGAVASVAVWGDTTYIGGVFTQVGPNTGHGVPIDVASGAPVKPYPRLDSTVYAAVDDGAGGWFVAGDFTNACGITRNRLAHLASDGSLDLGWNPNPDGTVVYALALSADGQSVFAGGDFGNIGGRPRNRIAKLSAGGTGAADATWDPSANGIVRALALSADGSHVFAGGDFSGASSIGGQTRNHIAGLSTTGTGAADALWDPNANDVIQTLALSTDGNSVFAGGDFNGASSIGGQTRNFIARLDAGGTGTADATWDPNANDTVYTVAPSTDGSLFVGGIFQGSGSIGGQTRKFIAKLTASGTGAADPTWDPNPNNPVYITTVSADGNSVFAGGIFSSIGGQSRNRIARLDSSSTGAADPAWDPNASGTVYVLSLSADGSALFSGGTFSLIGCKNRNRLAAIDNATGEATDWNPDSKAVVRTLAVATDGSSVFAGGEFHGTNSIGGQTRNYIAKLSSSSTGVVDPAWDPNANGVVLDLVLSDDGSSLFVAGGFNGSGSIGGQARNRIAKLSTTGAGAADPTWDPNASDLVWSLSPSPDGNSLFAGGWFSGASSIGGQARNRIAKLSTTGAGAADPAWDPNANDAVYSVVVSPSGRSVYAAGFFNGANSIGGQARNHIARLDPGGTGAANATWNPNATGDVMELAVTPDGYLYAGGDFQGTNSIGGQNRNFLAKLGMTGTGAAVAEWNPDPDASVDALALNHDGYLFVGGQFGRMGGQPQPKFARFSPPPIIDTVAPRNIENLTDNFDPPVYIDGSGYDMDIKATLQRGTEEVDPVGWVVYSGHLELYFYPDNTAAEDWTIVLRNPDGQTTTFPDFKILNPDPVPQTVTPTTAVNDQTAVEVTVKGEKFAKGCGIVLKKGSETIVPSGETTRVDPATAKATFDLAGASAGNWDVQVTNPAPASKTGVGTLAEALRIDSDLSTWYLAEGTNAWGFNTYMTIENPNSETVHAQLSYMATNPAAAGRRVLASRTITLPPLSQTTVSSEPVIGKVDFSTKVECPEGKPIAVDRTMFWTGEGQSQPGYHSSIGAAAPSRTWYLPEGSSAWGFETWTAVLNPNDTEAHVTLSYMTQNGPVAKTKTIPPNSRATYSMAADIGTTDASIKVSSDLPVVAERSVYRNNRREGSCSIGATAPADDYYLAEGAVGYGAGFTTYVLVQNPQDSDNEVSITYQTQNGPAAGPRFTMKPNSRQTIKVNEGMPADSDVSTVVHGSKPLVAERAMYWDNGQAFHASIGLSAPHTAFMLPDGQTSDGFETWTLVENPNAVAVNITVTYMAQGGEKLYRFNDKVPAGSRRSYNMADMVPSRRASIFVESKDSGHPVLVERAMYGENWGWGTDTIGGFSD